MNRSFHITCCRTLLSLALVLSAGGTYAQLYKSVGPDGKVTYSDTPPAAGKVEKKLSVENGPNTSNLPYELAQAVKNSPVTLYTSGKCTPCDDGRKFLNARGIPFSEKTVNSNEDIAQFKQLSGDTQLPFLTVGRNKQRGFESGAWNSTLSAAGYPENSQLPKNYRNPSAESTAPTPEKATKQEQQAKTRNQDSTPLPSPLDSRPPAAGNAPPGFHF